MSKRRHACWMKRMDVERLAGDAVGLFLEYRDQHGFTESEAASAAVVEVMQGWDAMRELRVKGTNVLDEVSQLDELERLPF